MPVAVVSSRRFVLSFCRINSERRIGASMHDAARSTCSIGPCEVYTFAVR